MNSCVEALTPVRLHLEIEPLMVNAGHRCGALIWQLVLEPFREETAEFSLPMHLHRGGVMWGQNGKVHGCEPSPKSGASIWTYSLQNYENRNVCGLSPLVCVFHYGSPSTVMSYILKTGFRDLHEWTYFAFTTALWDKYCYDCFQFTDEETEAQLGLTYLTRVTQLVNNGARIWIQAI